MRQARDSGGSSDVGLKGSGTRGNALWGKGRRRYSLLLALAVLAASITAGTTTGATAAGPKKAFVPKELSDKANDNPGETIEVIIQTDDLAQVDVIGGVVDEGKKKHSGKAKGVKKKLGKVKVVTAEITGDQLEDIASADGVVSVTEDSAVHATGYGNSQNWASVVGTQWGKAPKGADYPTIAIVDSGVQGRGDFDSRFAKQVDFTSDGSNSKGDGFGHGTFVAGLAAGDKDGYTGVEPRARFVSLDVLDDKGFGKLSDVIAACDWILANMDRYNIRIANFSLQGGAGGSIRNNPLNQAVEKLWLNGVVVVAAAGNYAVDGAASNVLYAPANDPFVITVGASDTNGTVTPSDDFAAPWSAWGLTPDAFRKPELSAPGRVLNGPAPKNSLMYTANPSRTVADGYMWMSGTSFSAPIVAGAAATLLSRHPDWTPDQVKGALMVSASVPAGYNSAGALGVGTLNLTAALEADGGANPNAGLNRFVVSGGATGLRSFDSTGWAAAAAGDPTWNTASWSSASWSSASWSSASWASMFAAQ